mgnify:CR=1 FL=1
MSKKKLTLKEIIRKNISRIRKEQGISQEQLGFKADIHRAYIGFIERGSKSPNVDHLEKIANALKVPVTKLFLEIED